MSEDIAVLSLSSTLASAGVKAKQQAQPSVINVFMVLPRM
jgi:hypothetical protein